ncbi:MAG: hypothetical protein IJX78_07830 [Bacilli bacterium]|nr:hypothetical protein [Bacilli bacterium]
MSDLEKKNYYNILFGYYGVLLTEKQQTMFEEYYGEDYSLAEIAEEHNISRNAVHDTIKKVLNSLDEFEKKLGLYEKDQKLNKLLKEYEQNENCLELIKRIQEME